MIETATMNSPVQYKMSEDEMIAWVLGVDRRLVLVGSMRNHPILKASDIAQETRRSVQNISRALREFMDLGLIRCINPEKSSWKRYTITSSGKELLRKLDESYFSHN